MNNRFHDLSKEKQMRVINAGLEVFSKNDYKHAVTDDIACNAGISKGLLFYYFHNKQELYVFLINYVMKLTEKYVLDDKFKEITDFFELLEYASMQKIKVINKFPYLIDFVMKAYYSSRSSKDNTLAKMLNTSPDNKLYEKYFLNINKSKFKNPDKDMQTVMQMMLWMGEGYLLEQQRMGTKTDIYDFAAKFKEWSIIFKQAYYKEEYL